MQNISSYTNNDADYNDDFDFSAGADAENCINLTVPTDLAGQRLDAALAKLLPDYSRSRLSTWIKDGNVLLNGQVARPKERLIGGETLEVHIQHSHETAAFTPEPMPLDIVFEDDSVIVLNKPAGLVVHPAAGNWSGTLLNGLLAHCPALAELPRAGIVPFDGKIDTLIGRDPHNRLKMAVVGFGGKKAVTHIKVLERYQSHSYIECALETGRTHQIRVHMREAKHPLAADPVYGNPRHPCSDAVKEAVHQLARQALHAYRLSFVHPESGETVQFEAPLPEDIHHLLSVLRWECGMDSALSHTLPPAELDDEDDWDDDDYDVETIYVRD